jgi:hypothetical protein
MFCLLRLSISFRHRSSWQDAGSIQLNRAELVRFIYELADKLDVNFEMPPVRRLMYDAGVLKSGQVDGFKTNLLKLANIRRAVVPDEEPE